MKNKFIRVILALALTLGFVATPHVASEAASIFIATVRVEDVNGKPVPNVELMVTSLSAGGTALGVTVVTNAKGEAKAQVYPGEYRLYITLGERCFDIYGATTGFVDKSDPVILLETPALRNFKFKLVSEAGLPLANQQVSLWGAQYEMGFYCGQTNDRTDINGVATVKAFALDMSKYLDPTYTHYEQMRNAIAFVNPFDNVQVMVQIPFEEWVDGYAEVVVEDVPSINVKAPTQVYPNSYFNIYGTIMNADGTASNAALRTSAPTRSYYKTALLWKRELVKGRWSQWKQVKSVRVDARGKALFTKIKIKYTSQFQIRGHSYSLGAKTIQIKVKAK